MLLNYGVGKSPLDCKEIKSVHPKGNQSWIFIGKTGAEAEVLIFWPPDVKNWLIGKDPDAGEDWRQEKDGMTEDKMLDDITTSMNVSSNKLWETVKPALLQSMGLQRVRQNWAAEQDKWIDGVFLFLSLT